MHAVVIGCVSASACVTSSLVSFLLLKVNRIVNCIRGMNQTRMPLSVSNVSSLARRAKLLHTASCRCTIAPFALLYNHSCTP